MFSPLEQFQIIPLIPIRLGAFDFSFTNASFMLVVNLIVLVLFFSFIGKGLYIPHRWQTVIETIYEVVYDMIVSAAGKKGQSYFPLIFTLFIFILMSNVIGMIPYSFTITSHLIVTIFFALMVFITLNVEGVIRHQWRLFGLFMPPGAPLLLAPLLIPIEFIAYVFRVISLSVRLFANMMAGHILLKVFAGFAWAMFSNGSIALMFAHLFPLAVIFVLFGLELGVAMIQAYVFTILTCIYLNDVINLH